ncbi:MAG: hypothetical protein P8K77_08710 [Polaribacter sp.]|nr:hypothetical protein [Polaribacter sp.]
MTTISIGKLNLQIDVIYQFITNSYWAEGRRIFRIKVKKEEAYASSFW